MLSYFYHSKYLILYLDFVDLSIQALEIIFVGLEGLLHSVSTLPVSCFHLNHILSFSWMKEIAQMEIRIAVP